jgi:hypothetical protein
MSVAVIGAKLWSYLPFLLLTISLLVGVPIAYRHYREVREVDEPIRDSDLLTDLEQGDAANLMTEAEFRRVRELLNGSQTQGDATVPTKPARRKPERR